MYQNFDFFFLNLEVAWFTDMNIGEKFYTFASTYHIVHYI